jgi:serine/threonine protein kinase
MDEYSILVSKWNVLRLEESSVLGSRWNSLASSLDPILPPSGHHSAERAGIMNTFLALIELFQSVRTVKLHSELLPLFWLETVGEGVSFTVKKGAMLDSSGREVVYKISRLRFSNEIPGMDPLSDENLETRRYKEFATELRILSHPPVLSHPNIVQLLRIVWFINPVINCIVSPALELEYAHIGTLSDFQDSGGKLSFHTKLDLCYDIATGLATLHDCGIVHGDVKSENVLIFRDPQKEFLAKICDFGGAVITTPGTNEKGEDVMYKLGGTPRWMAPETSSLISMRKMHFTDVYSFGLLIWKVIVDGRDPFSLLDIPTEPTIRNGSINEFLNLDLADLSFVILSTVVSICGDLSGETRNSLLMIFIWTLAQNPEERNLSGVREILSLACNRTDLGYIFLGFPANKPAKSREKDTRKFLF